MTIEYKTDENDYLTHQLFVASRSAGIRKRRQRTKLLVPIAYAVLGILFLLQGNDVVAIVFFLIGLLWYFIYPVWERRRYINHYRGFIQENFKDRFGRSATIEFNDDYIFAKDNGNEFRIMITELEGISEIPSTIFVRLKGGQSIILPKEKISGIGDVKTRLKELADGLNIAYEVDEQWEWK